MNLLPPFKREMILRCLVEGLSVRATSRLVDVSKNTVQKLLREIGPACWAYQEEHLRGLECEHIEVDEIWSFIYAKEKNKAKMKRRHRRAGDVWTWVAIDRKSKLVPAWKVGDRTAKTARALMKELKRRLEGRIQLTSDGHQAYIEAVDETFGREIDYAMLVKHFGEDKEEGGTPRCDALEKTRIMGQPDMDAVSTSIAERHNLTMRMCMRRFTRKTNAFSKKLAYHRHAVSLYIMYYNFCRIHQTLRVTPAMEAGVTEKLWDLKDVLKLL